MTPAKIPSMLNPLGTRVVLRSVQTAANENTMATPHAIILAHLPFLAHNYYTINPLLSMISVICLIFVELLQTFLPAFKHMLQKVPVFLQVWPAFSA